jgi:hypothetical protein
VGLEAVFFSFVCWSVVWVFAWVGRWWLLFFARFDRGTCLKFNTNFSALRASPAPDRGVQQLRRCLFNSLATSTLLAPPRALAEVGSLDPRTYSAERTWTKIQKLDKEPGHRHACVSACVYLRVCVCVCACVCLCVSPQEGPLKSPYPRAVNWASKQKGAARAPRGKRVKYGLALWSTPQRPWLALHVFNAAGFACVQRSFVWFFS